MGREIRRVPANWEHPKQERYGDDRYQPMHDERFEDAVKEWKDGFAAWERGERPSYYTREEECEFWEYEGDPPEREYYRPYTDEEATWWQVYETVSEGTPVSPPFATPDELIEYLATRGDFWDQKRGDGPWNRAAAERFVKSGWAPSMIVTDGRVVTPKEMDAL